MSDPSYRLQAAEANADRIMSRGGFGGEEASAMAQRADAPEGEEEPVQGLWVQREDALEKEETERTPE